jgi:hypothetical protein
MSTALKRLWSVHGGCELGQTRVILEIDAELSGELDSQLRVLDRVLRLHNCLVGSDPTIGLNERGHVAFGVRAPRSSNIVTLLPVKRQSFTRNQQHHNRKVNIGGPVRIFDDSSFVYIVDRCSDKCSPTDQNGLMYSAATAWNG